MLAKSHADKAPLQINAPLQTNASFQRRKGARQCRAFPAEQIRGKSFKNKSKKRAKKSHPKAAKSAKTKGTGTIHAYLILLFLCDNGIL